MNRVDNAHWSAASRIQRERIIADMPFERAPEFATPLRTVLFAVMGVTVFAAFFGALLS
jgi:hypothetical protein